MKIFIALLIDDTGAIVSCMTSSALIVDNAVPVLHDLVTTVEKYECYSDTLIRARAVLDSVEKIGATAEEIIAADATLVTGADTALFQGFTRVDTFTE